MKINYTTIIKKNILKQIAICICAISLILSICFYLKAFISYRIVGIFLLFVVSIFAAIFDIIPVLISAILSSILLNFFFIPPLFTFHIGSSEDFLFFIIFFIVAIVNAVLTFKIREQEKKIRDKEDKDKTIKLYNTIFNSLSHELRTPLATILASVDTLQQSNTNLPQQHITTLLDQINIAGIRLNQQVENLLNMSRLETGMLKLNKTWCDSNELIFTTINNAYSNNEHKILFTQNENMPFVKLDTGIMLQVLQNLISNAINYTPKHSTIAIENSLHNDINLQICISDNGKGVPEEHIHNLFDKFYRVPNTATGGTGLGLSIVKAYVEAHGGTIIAKNSKPNGLQIMMNIPVETTYINKLKND